MCTGAASTQISGISPPNHKFVSFTVSGVTDAACGGATTILIQGIRQDEPTLIPNLGSGDDCPDATGVGTATAAVRAERDGSGDGRVYHILFKATDCNGNSCTGDATVCVPHNQSAAGQVCVDEGPLYDSTKCP